MKRIFALMLVVALLVSVPVGCGKKENGATTGEAQASGAGESRDPMPAYERLGVSNSIATSDGRYIYYTYRDTTSTSNEGRLCRTDMNGENMEELDDLPLHDLYIDEGYLYYGHGMVLHRVDIATGPRYFNSKNGYVNAEVVVDKEMLGDRMGVNSVRSDEEYLYFDTTGLCRMKKGTDVIEEIAYGEDFVNFYDLTVENGFLYAYCSDDGMIYRMNPDGSDATVICDVAGTYQIYDGYVYSKERGTGADVLVRTGLDDGKTERVGMIGGEEYTSATFRNAMGDQLYYVCWSRENETYVIRSYDLTTGEDRVIAEADTNIEKVDIVGDFIFFERSDYILMRVNADGSGLVQVGT